MVSVNMTFLCIYTVEPLNNGHGGDEQFVHCSEVVPLSEVEMYGQLMEGGKQFVHCREVVLLSECPLSEVLLYMYTQYVQWNFSNPKAFGQFIISGVVKYIHK